MGEAQNQISTMRIYKGGLQTTIQDRGRMPFMAYGVSCGGAMDLDALRAVNLLLGNAPYEPVLEMTLTGPELILDADRWIVLGGAEIVAHLEHQPIPMWQPVYVKAGQRLRIGEVKNGVRAYLAVDGGFQVQKVLGGYGTDVRAKFGGETGRALKAGDRIRLGPAKLTAPPFAASIFAPILIASSLRTRDREDEVRVFRGMEMDEFTHHALDSFFSTPYTVDGRSDRMGIRLQGKPLTREVQDEMLSTGVVFGTIQVPPDGQPVILGADAQTTGGYPRIAQVAEVDLSVVAQLRAGDVIYFKYIELAEAEQLLIQREKEWLQFTFAVKQFWTRWRRE